MHIPAESITALLLFFGIKKLKTNPNKERIVKLHPDEAKEKHHLISGKFFLISGRRKRIIGDFFFVFAKI